MLNQPFPAAGQSCNGQISLDNINSVELDCQRRPDCSGITCFSLNSFLKNFVELFEFRPLPCAMPSPALRLRVSSGRDPRNNQRTLVWNETLTNSSNAASLAVRSSSGDITFGTYQFSANFSEANVGIGVSSTVKNNMAPNLV